MVRSLLVAALLLLLGPLHHAGFRLCAGDTFRIGRRVHGDRTVLKKVLLSVPSSVPTNHTVIYEYHATKAVSCIEYHVENLADEAEHCEADIAYTGEYSLAATFQLFNITELVIVMSIYGFDQFSVPLHFQPILVPQSLSSVDGAAAKFGLGQRRPDDELVYFYTQSSLRTERSRNHSLVFEAQLEHFVTYVEFAVDSKTAGVTFLLLTEHEFAGIVYDTNSRILFANLYVYGYKKEKLPADYVSLLPPPPELTRHSTLTAVPFDGDEIIELTGGRIKLNGSSTTAGSRAGKAYEGRPACLWAIAAVIFSCILAG